MAKWDIQEHKIWKGIDPQKPVWAGRGFAFSTYEDAVETMQYLEHNSPSVILRVGPLQFAFQHAS